MKTKNYKLNLINLFRLDENIGSRSAKINGILFAAIDPDKKSKKDIDFIKSNKFTFLYTLDLWDIYGNQKSKKALLQSLIEKEIIIPVPTGEEV